VALAARQAFAAASEAGQTVEVAISEEATTAPGPSEEELSAAAHASANHRWR